VGVADEQIWLIRVELRAVDSDLDVEVVLEDRPAPKPPHPRGRP
jgi:hypothetical protein